MAGPTSADAPSQEALRAEVRLLAKLAPAAIRQGLRLQVKAANGEAVRFDSVHPGDAHPEDYVDHRLTGTSPDGKFFVVSSRSYEGETTFWVSRTTGQKVEVFEPPEVSLDGRYAVTALHRESTGPSGVFVWEIVGDRLLPRDHIEHGDYGLFTFKRWTGNDTAELELFSHSYLKFCLGAQSTTATVRLIRSTTGWTVAAPTQASQVRCE
ncbi:hypothetical protein [Roseateles sp. P5_E4]